MRYVYLRIEFGETEAIGPFRAALLEAVDQSSSIAAAARRMAISYSQAWKALQLLNGMFSEPLMTTKRGGFNAGGAALTPLGKKVVALYRAAERDAHAAIGPHASAMNRLLREHLRKPQPRRLNAYREMSIAALRKAADG